MIAWLLVACLACTVASAQAEVAAHQQVSGRIVVPDPGYKLGDVFVTINTDAGRQIRAYCKGDGVFVVNDLPTGSHLLSVTAMGYMFPDVKLDVTRVGLLRASDAANKQAVYGSPLVIGPMTGMEYFEKRKPLDLWSLIKSPYGIMVCMMLFCIVVLPMMKMSPEELNEYYGRKPEDEQQQLQQQQPSIDAAPASGRQAARRRGDN